MLYEPLIRKLESIETLTEAERRAAVALCSDQRSVERRTDIVREGAAADHVHIVLSGWAARYNILNDGSRRITAFLLPGDFCDVHVTVLSEMDHGIIAVTNCKVAFATKEQIDDVTGRTPALTRAFWRSTLIDEAILRRWLVHGGRSEAFETVAHLFCELHVRARLVGLTDDHSFALPLTQEEIGDATGLTAVHVNRVLRRLREEGLATIKGGDLKIHDIDALRRASGFNPNYLHLRSRDSRA